MKVTESQIKDVLAKLFKIEPATIDDDSSMDNIEAWDSLNHLKLVLALESAFDVSFTEEESVEILNFALIKEVLSEHGIEIE